MNSKNPTTFLGLYIGKKESSVALVEEGRLIIAAKETDFRKTLSQGSFPLEALKYCLKESGIRQEQISSIAIANNPWFDFWNRFLLEVRYPKLASLEWHRRKLEQRPLPFTQVLRNLKFQSKIVRVPHYLCHLYNVRYQSPKENLAMLSLDSLGDAVSTVMAEAHENEIELHKKVYFPHSLGTFSKMMAQFLGFIEEHEEPKMLELAHFGKPKYLSSLRKVVREEPNGFKLNLELIQFNRSHASYVYDNGRLRINPIFQTSLLTQIVGIPPRKPSDKIEACHADLARSVQDRFEEIGFHLLNELSKLVSTRNLAITGDCTKNSNWLGKVLEKSPFKSVVVSSTGDDVGLALGAVVATSKAAITPTLKSWTTFIKEKTLSEKQIAEIIKAIGSNSVVGFTSTHLPFTSQGVGQSSLIWNPCQADIYSKVEKMLNLNLKERPVLALINSEYLEDCFEHTFDTSAAQAKFKASPDSISKLGGLVRPDGVCHVQSVRSSDCPNLWKLIDGFQKKSKTPALACLPLGRGVLETLFRNGIISVLIEGSNVQTHSQANQEASSLAIDPQAA